jgi:hypothetical protein
MSSISDQFTGFRKFTARHTQLHVMWPVHYIVLLTCGEFQSISHTLSPEVLWHSAALHSVWQFEVILYRFKCKYAKGMIVCVGVRAVLAPPARKSIPLFSCRQCVEISSDQPWTILTCKHLRDSWQQVRVHCAGGTFQRRLCHQLWLPCAHHRSKRQVLCEERWGQSSGRAYLWSKCVCGLLEAGLMDPIVSHSGPTVRWILRHPARCLQHPRYQLYSCHCQ